MGVRDLCFLCKAKRGPRISLYRFPKDSNVRKAWMSFCKLDESIDNVSTLFICSAHFTESDYSEPRAKEIGGILKLKHAAVPSFFKGTFQMSSTEVSTSAPTLNPEEDFFTGPSTSAEASIENLEHTPKKMKLSVPRYFGGIRSPHVSSPRKARKCLQLAREEVSKLTKRVKILQQRNRRFQKRIQTLEDLLKHLNQKNLISEENAQCMVEGLPANIKDLIARMLQMKGKGQYSPELRRFALTLQFYSSVAYNYLRKTWCNLLPHPSTLRKWYSVVDGKPGFSKEAFSAISTRNQEKPVVINVVIDEMSIRSQLVFQNGQFYGGINFGTDLSQDSDNVFKAKYALAFLAVSLNGHWKVPLGYFLIDGLKGAERANLLCKCLYLIDGTGAKVYFVTFDGDPANLSMCTNLGANFDYYSPNFKPWIINPTTQDRIWIFWDACHMLKLVRSTLDDRGMLIDSEGNFIKWSFIEKLQQLQLDEGLHAGTKLTKKHINYQDNRMNVKLAAQTFSERVYNAFQFVDRLNVTELKGCMPTADFCLNINNIFDLLNCRNKFSQKNRFNIPIDEHNVEFLSSYATRLESYICGLKDSSGMPILKTNRKTGFLGLIICLRNSFEQLREVGQEYLLTYKLNQDYLETLFSAIRIRGGFNNNHNARQFESAYKRLLIHHEISTSYNSNCLADGVEILHVSSRKAGYKEPLVLEESITCDILDHDYLSSLWTLTPYVENVVKYIAGFIVHKIITTQKTLCHICASQLIDNRNVPLLIEIKNRGKLVAPSDAVSKICLIVERYLRQNMHVLFTKKNIKQFLMVSILQAIQDPFDSDAMNNHILSQDIVDNHKIQLMKLIIETFLNIRMFYEAKCASQKDEYIRQKYTKLVLFANQ